MMRRSRLSVVGSRFSGRRNRTPVAARRGTLAAGQTAPLSPKQPWARGLFVAALWFSALLLGSAGATEATVSGTPGANLEVSLYTFGPGAEVWERFGHNSIEIRDRSSVQARLYNYGIFDFGQ